jgi:hypothetical protein
MHALNDNITHKDAEHFRYNSKINEGKKRKFYNSKYKYIIKQRFYSCRKNNINNNIKDIPAISIQFFFQISTEPKK